MASTYTDSNGLEKPGTGEQSGTWGTTLNENFDLIDEAVDGLAAVSISGSASLTMTDGSTSNGRKRVIVYTGTLAGNATITVSPNASRWFPQSAGPSARL